MFNLTFPALFSTQTPRSFQAATHNSLPCHLFLVLSCLFCLSVSSLMRIGAAPMRFTLDYTLIDSTLGTKI